MSSLIMALGTVEHSLLHLPPSPPLPSPPSAHTAFLSSDPQSRRNVVMARDSKQLSRAPSPTMKSSTSSSFSSSFSSTHRAKSELVGWTESSWRAPSSGRKFRSSSRKNYSSYNCTNVYPHVESTIDLNYQFQYQKGYHNNEGVNSDGVEDDNEDGSEDEDEDRDMMFMGRMCVDTLYQTDSATSETDSDDSVCDSDSDDPSSSSSSTSTTMIEMMMDDEQLLVEFGRRPRVFDDTETMAFYISPLAITQLSVGLWTRSRPACVIINTSIPRQVRFDDMDWSTDALRMLNTPNAGGSSLLSEVLSIEMLNRCLGATLAKTEMEIRYLFAYQPITDYTITLPNLSPRMHVGVSVTRAFAFKGAYKRADCRKLLWKKLTGILASTRNVIGERFFKQILHVWVPNGKVARTVQATYRSLPIEVTRNTVVIISVVNARWVFSNRR
ncbi:hypothetical protein BCR41DRAFT_50528 [Lobosporangium transversale]|uniref:Uncharacterized protein n=1 Tax=Lobosporangium transversale TaxID=64571 RepID=A0A1Y2GQN9_9FUNG|nr:hypothetical protein BCR41DRAFT_50528 [Lobosporangium transversale]ORZ17565.1 hypothetical protein BCR41DRAFT_50528 [Lobosporangium transversale]|eukprot:XP_021881952.1 hypothetical protein BCR41DRAFT_50528 [Lobosporangium transversale]